MLDFSKYIPDSVRRWTAPRPEKQKPHAEHKPKPVSVAEFVRMDGTEGDRRTRLIKTSEEQIGESTVRERFTIQADIGIDDEGGRAFEAVGDRTAQFNTKDRIIYFEDTHIENELRGSGLGTDSYKAFIEYANRRARELDLKAGRETQEPWTVTTAPENPITRHQFEKFFRAENMGFLMVGTLRTLEEIETEERLEAARKRIEEITGRKAA
ncbi:hypothetical protein A2304_00155 [Candidatus Uhrbacteria bacterium RIFOXYB2_FULL_57_15]|uniref:Uncharacterized protein n=1 Tax=Candidatus Uhrbacteria bacterium RIFOXYB2_FULL_57_15 TaxID=1802422 RepID=A0A1F7W654_9BACT|nr:MAG: hypothetical protein A2304_00155 [Candidatus Uhrbacteria bacterium RIFOXYB2_FULL_57_15]OGL98938.1 MAG: hypothetical protein A2501_02300 [Candidatus Uhrbacteria bacterium RIFOXYC12_FULL_57_11]